jgi:uncharacterized protein YbjT (DUF2867 family)
MAAARNMKLGLQALLYQQNRTCGVSASKASKAAAPFSASTSTVGGGVQQQSEEPVVEAEPVETKFAERSKLLVLGGNGFVGTHVCQEALTRHIPVVSISRSGRPAAAAHDHHPWMNGVNWIQGDILHPERWKHALQEVSAVISCVGAFGSNQKMLKINGEANIAAINAASESGVTRFVYISAVDYGLPSFVLGGYFKGKKAAEEALLRKFPYGGIILRPGFIYGSRQVGSVKIPLSVIGTPLEFLLNNAKSVSRLPLVGNFLLPPVKVTSVARAAVRSAIDNAVPPGILDVWGIKRLGDR